MAARDNGITSFGLRNFKAFHYLEDIELKPLTLLVGANSSGKSSIFQSLLLLKQSLLSGSGGGPLKFDGEWVRLGGLDSIAPNFDRSRVTEYRLAAKTFLPAWEMLASESARTGHDSRSAPTAVDAQVHFSVVASPHDGAAQLDSFIIKLSGQGIRPEHEQIRIEGAELEIGGKTIDLQESSRKYLFQRFLPDVAWIDHLLLSESRDLRAERFFVHDSVLAMLRQDLSRTLDYLGPVRADPRPFYPVSDEPVVGTRGEGAIPYLLRHKDDHALFAPGPFDRLHDDGLFSAVNHWLQRMRVTPGITIDSVESIAYTAAVRSPLVKSRPVNLSQVGFGVSQILPVLIQGLRNPTNAWILFEQPEIHLHPRLQGELGDFFLACARAGKTLMVETHSDHLVHRIRRRIAEDTTGELADMVQILFVHAGTEEEPGSYVEPLRVAPDGSIENWPEDFLQDAADEAWAILRARQARSKQAPP